MDETQRLNLNKLASDPNFKDNTELIRKIRHSEEIKKDLDKLIELKAKSTSKDICCESCQFLFKNYTDIFNKIFNNELQSSLLYEFIDCLKLIEEGELNQHEGSFRVGQILKQIYVDSALSRAKNLNNKNSESKENSFRKPTNISWKEFKQYKNTNIRF